MSSKPRYHPSWPLPEYAYIPGVNEHPHLEAPVADESDLLKYAIDLFNHAYFWESHVYFESIWNARGREDSVSDFCKAMIKLGAAGVKLSREQDENALVHLKRAKEIFLTLKKNEGPIFLKFDLEKIVSEIDSNLRLGLRMFEVHPVPETDHDEG